MCYPECLILSVTSIWNKVNCCCPMKKQQQSLGEEEEGGDYVGGKMDVEGGSKKKKKKRIKMKVEEPKGLVANSGVELV